MSPILGIWASQNYPRITNSYESIATFSGTGSSGIITFSSIPSTYKHLQIRFIARSTGSAASYLAITLNSTTTNYYGHYLAGSGTSASAGPTGVTNQMEFYQAIGNSTSSSFGAGILDILDYTDTNKNTTVRGLTGTDFNGSGSILLGSNAWFNTAAVTSIKIEANQGSYVTGSQFALYGIKG